MLVAEYSLQHTLMASIWGLNFLFHLLGRSFSGLRLFVRLKPRRVNGLATGAGLVDHRLLLASLEVTSSRNTVMLG